MVKTTAGPPWGSPRGAPEPTTPFHGVIYPDGHPLALADVQAIRNDDLSADPVFNAEYFTGILQLPSRSYWAEDMLIIKMRAVLKAQPAFF